MSDLPHWKFCQRTLQHDHEGGEEDHSNQKGHQHKQFLQQHKFQGKVEALKGTIYNVGASRGDDDSFARTTRNIAEHVTQQVKGAGEILIAMDPNNLAFKPLINAPPPGTGAGMAKIEIWKMDLEEYRSRLAKRQEASRQAYAFIIGHCSDVLCDQRKILPVRQTISTTNDIIGPLQVIQQSMVTVWTTQEPYLAMLGAQQALMTFWQTEHMTPNVYWNKFKALADAVKYHSGDIAYDARQVKEQLDTIADNSLHPTAKEQKLLSRKKKKT